jgi:hypothetical protein
MVTDRHIFVVRQQVIVRPKELADILRVMDADIEVGIVADAGRQVHGHVRCPMQQRFEGRSCIAAGFQQFAQPGP